ncbi:hypothetical protein BDQ12DRAFT_719916 [Crucibulum laeve]|uniref:Uncharacterized protein n=1 Tax=Crucibulum laeve TaxID=68775 RepID=A0A5C3MBQ6_9AGAR|nr:hypothetical protein BDQ12DRAFT_719916 [Crucibulum laeve]
MDIRSQGVLVSAASVLYASTGFVLSVVAAILGIFIHVTANKDIQHIPLRSRSSQLSSPRGRKSSSPTNLKSFKAKADHASNLALKRVQLPVHRRSKSSIPIITIHKPDLIDAPRASISPSSTIFVPEPVKSDPAPINITPNSTSETSSLDDPFISPPQLSEQPSSESHRHCFKLSHLKHHWAEKKKPKMNRCLSSPDLSGRHSSRSSSETPPPLPTRTISEGESIVFAKIQSKPIKSPQMETRTSEEKPSVKSKSSFSRSVEKKRSQPLRARTQPYEAPYFFPQPVPMPKTDRSRPSTRDGASTESRSRSRSSPKTPKTS